ncbi:HAD hydrolase-like protein [Candidatus Saccharibacteria bacterium]|nr:HAD hydrolase-like protein [Candidatus Saccharibacteria bacterium]
MKYKVAIFDADGVLTIPKELFSEQYVRNHGGDLNQLSGFFKNDFQNAIIGKADLKELIAEYHDVWQWNGSPDELLSMWFRNENIQNKPMLELVATVRNAGVPCYLATNQEKYRGEYMREIMFPGIFDYYFISSEMGCKKPEQEYFEKLLSKVAEDHPRVKPKEIIFLDDTVSHVEGAKKLGINAHLFESVYQAESLLI